MQEFLRDPTTPLSHLLAEEENPVHLMMRICEKKKVEFENLNQYEDASRCIAVKESLEQLIMQAKPLSAILLEILEALLLRKDQANSLDLSFRHLERLRLEFAAFDSWIRCKLRKYKECIDLIRYGNGATQNRKMVIPLALRKGMRLTNPDLVRSTHPPVPSITATFNRYGQVHGIRCRYKYSKLKIKGVIRELRLLSQDSASLNSSPGADNRTGFMNQGGGEDSKGASSSQSIDSASDNNGVSKVEDSNSNDIVGEVTFSGGASRKGLGMIDRRIMKKIMSRLEYEFTARAGRFQVLTVYKKNFIVNRVHFRTLDLRHNANIGEAAFEPGGSHTSYGTNELLKLVEEMTMQALLS